MKVRSVRGFSVTEVAIVVCVVGVVFSGIWTMATNSRASVRQENFTEMLQSVVTNIRGAYSGKVDFNSTAATVMMPLLTSMHVFPDRSTRVASGWTVVDSPFGTTVNPLFSASEYNSMYVCGWAALGSTNCHLNGPGAVNNVPLFAVEVLFSRPDECIGAVLRNSNPAALPGLVAVFINQVRMTLPLTLPVARTNCDPLNSVVSDATVVDFVFRLRP